MFVTKQNAEGRANVRSFCRNSGTATTVYCESLRGRESVTLQRRVEEESEKAAFVTLLLERGWDVLQRAIPYFLILI